MLSQILLNLKEDCKKKKNKKKSNPYDLVQLQYKS